MATSLKIAIEVDDKGTVKFKKFGRSVDTTGSKVIKFGGKIGKTARQMGGLARSTANAIGKTMALGVAAVTAAAAFAAWKIKGLAQRFIETGSSMDKLKLSLDTITKGKGAEWFEKLNKWALKMPINTAKAIKSFIMLRAMGLKLLIKDMATLVDTTSALGGGADVLESIARALGQIHTKGKVSAEELGQLAERGIPAIEILREKLGLTAEQVGNIGAAGIKAEDAVKALLEGMAERFGGQSAKIMNKWSGLWESMKGYWTEFQRLVMSSGVMAYLEENLKAVVGWADRLYTSGKLKLWAQEAADKIVAMGQRFKTFIADSMGGWDNFEVKARQVLQDIRQWINDLIPSFKAAVTAVGWVAEAFNVVGRAIGWVAAQIVTMGEKFISFIGESLGGWDYFKVRARLALRDVRKWLNDLKPIFKNVFREASIAVGWLVDVYKKVDKAIGHVITTANRLINLLDKLSPVRAIVEFLGKSSPVRPLIETISTISGQLSALQGQFAGGMSFTADMGGVGAAIQKQISEIAYWKQKAVAAVSGGGQYAYLRARDAAAQLAGARAGLKSIMETMEPYGAGTPVTTAVAGGSKVNVEQINIQVQTPFGIESEAGMRDVAVKIKRYLQELDTRWD